MDNSHSDNIKFFLKATVIAGLAFAILLFAVFTAVFFIVWV